MYNLILIVQVLSGPEIHTTHSQVFTDLKKCKAAARVMTTQPRVKKAFCRGKK